MANRPAWDSLVVKDAIPPADVPAHIRDSHYLHAAKKIKTGDMNPLVWLPRPGCLRICPPCDTLDQDPTFAALREKALRFKCC